MSKVSNTAEVRSRIEKISDKSHRNALKFAWLGVCRASEVVGKAYPGDTKTTPRGPTGSSVTAGVYDSGDVDVPVILFEVKTSKRGGTERTAAYPDVAGYEPWALELRDYIKQFSPTQKVFDFNRQTLWRVARDAFQGLVYDIEEYNQVVDGVVIKCEKHSRVMTTHSIRHAKIVDLMSFHGFTLRDISVIAGFSLRGMGVSSSLSRYAHLEWQSYFQKMLINRGY